MPAINLRTIVPALAALATASAVHAQSNYYVDASAPAGGDGRSWNTAFRDIQDALDQVTPYFSYSPTIHVAQGVYTPDRGSLDRDMSFHLNSAITLIGGYEGLAGNNPFNNNPEQFVSVLSGDLARNDLSNFRNRDENSNQIIATKNSTYATLRGFTITGGNALSSWNPYGVGGVIGPEDGCDSCAGNISLFNCRIISNSAEGHSRPLISTRFLYMSDTLVAENQRLSGAALIDSLGAIVERSRILSNSAQYIVRIGNHNWPLNRHAVAHTVFAANSGISLCINGTDLVSITNCTIVDNVSSGGLSLLVPGGVRPRITLTNTIFYGNHDTYPSADINQIQTHSSGSVIDFYTYINLIERGSESISNPSDPFAALQPKFSGDPRLRSSAGADGDPRTWQDNDYRLRLDSPCVDSGSTQLLQSDLLPDLNGSSPFDLASIPNTGVGPVTYKDLGAYELVLCPADYDASGSISTQDLFAFLNDWFSRNAASDFDHNARVTIQDLFAFLSAWFAGCPNT